jgi:hypothetical protein
VLERQEEAVEGEERRAAALERDARRARDRIDMLELERDGLAARLAAAKEKMEEAEAMQATNQRVIAYLNRELNERAIVRQQSDRYGPAVRRTRRPAYVYSNDEDNDCTSSAPTAQARTTSSSENEIAPGSRAPTAASSAFLTSAATAARTPAFLIAPRAGAEAAPATGPAGAVS